MNPAVSALVLVIIVGAAIVFVRARSRVRGAIGQHGAQTEELETETPKPQRSEANLMTNLPGMVYRCKNEESRELAFVSEGCKALTGFGAAELTRRVTLPYAGLIFEEDRERVWSEIQQATDAHMPFKLTYRLDRGNGDLIWVSEQGHAVRDDRGAAVALEGFITEIPHNKALDPEQS